jgi:membrane protease YdiL (CAAX protease family)
MEYTLDSQTPTHPSIEPAPFNLPLRPNLRAGPVIAVLGLFLGIQFIIGFAVSIAATLIAICQGRDLQDPGTLALVTQSGIAPAVALGLVFSSAAMIGISVFWFRREIQDRSPTGAAWVIGESKFILAGLAIGELVACSYLATAPLMLEFAENQALGPFTKMAKTSGTQQIVWMLLVLLLAPPVEELLFRGVLFGGICRSWGPAWAAILTTGVFVLLHVTEMIYYWPAFMFVTLMALAALWIRLRSKAIGSSIALHFAYNFVLAGIALFSTI